MTLEVIEEGDWKLSFPKPELKPKFENFETEIEKTREDRILFRFKSFFVQFREFTEIFNVVHKFSVIFQKPKGRSCSTVKGLN